MLVRSWIVAVLFVCCVTESSSGEDYVLKIQVVGFEETVVGKEKPIEEVMRQLEVSVTVDKPFKVKSVNGRRTLSAKGRATKTKKGAFLVKLKIEDRWKTDDFLLGSNGEWEPCYDETESSSELSVKLGEPLTMLGIDTSQERTKLQSKFRFVIELTKWRKTDEEEAELKKKRGIGVGSRFQRHVSDDGVHVVEC